MIKLYIFETADDLKSYEQKAPAPQHPKPEPERRREDDPAPPLERTPHYKKETEKPIREYAKGKGYKKGICGKCGKTGHSAWKCPERPPKAGKGKRQKLDPKPRRTSEKKYDPEEVKALARRVAAREITAQQAADELGVSIGNWYGAKSRFAKEVQTEIHVAPRTKIENPDELREQIETMQGEGLSSLQIAARLKVSLATVNRYWRKDAEQLAPAAEGDIDETAIDDEAPPKISPDDEEIL